MNALAETPEHSFFCMQRNLTDGVMFDLPTLYTVCLQNIAKKLIIVATIQSIKQKVHSNVLSRNYGTGPNQSSITQFLYNSLLYSICFVFFHGLGLSRTDGSLFPDNRAMPSSQIATKTIAVTMLGGIWGSISME